MPISPLTCPQRHLARGLIQPQANPPEGVSLAVVIEDADFLLRDLAGLNQII